MRIPGNIRAAVSIHSHTNHSEECMDLIVRHANAVWASRIGFQKVAQRFLQRRGHPINWARAFWTPPVTPKAAIEIETRQIKTRYQLPALVSLTDHDNIEAGLWNNLPVSVEWTVPFHGALFHIGIHNLPRADAKSLWSAMHRYTTSNGREGNLTALFKLLDSFAQVLIVFNHPLYDEAEIGVARHLACVRRFLTENGAFIHALELNGIRTARENQQVAAMARELNLPAISGGDRHGVEPNSNLNLTTATNFDDFVSEIRVDKFSHVVNQPQYHHPVYFRRARVVIEAFRALAVYYRDEDGSVWPLRNLWDTTSIATSPFGSTTSA